MKAIVKASILGSFLVSFAVASAGEPAKFTQNPTEVDLAEMNDFADVQVPEYERKNSDTIQAIFKKYGIVLDDAVEVRVMRLPKDSRRKDSPNQVIYGRFYVAPNWGMTVNYSTDGEKMIARIAISPVAGTQISWGSTMAWMTFPGGRFAPRHRFVLDGQGRVTKIAIQDYEKDGWFSSITSRDCPDLESGRFWKGADLSASPTSLEYYQCRNKSDENDSMSGCANLIPRNKMWMQQICRELKPFLAP